MDAGNGSDPSEHAALDVLFREHYADLWDGAMGIVKNEHWAEDVVQTVYRRALMFSADFTNGVNGVAYLRRSVRNEAIHILAKEKAEGERAEALMHEPTRASPASPDKVLAKREVQTAVRTAIDQLPPRQAVAIKLIRLEDCTYALAATLMECSVNTVKEHVRRGEAVLRQNSALLELLPM